VILPSYEGEMGILKDHISIISFLRPGIVKILKSSENVNSFFLQNGIIEFFNNNLTILSSKVIDIKNLNMEKIDQLITETEKILKDEKLNDDNRYLANHKINALRSLNLN
jgi:ATP synthase F1 epsilon subunit